MSRFRRLTDPPLFLRPLRPGPAPFLQVRGLGSQPASLLTRPPAEPRAPARPWGNRGRVPRLAVGSRGAAWVTAEPRR